MMISRSAQNNIEILQVENEHLSISVVPAMGGKISSIFNKKLSKEFLWLNNKLPFVSHAPGSEYDSNFIGGIDELIPNDLTEAVDDIEYPDHGELWTTALDHIIEEDKVIVQGVLPLSGLYYSKIITLDPDSPFVNIFYTIRNDNATTRHFLWKLHAALQIQKGDRLVTNARYAQVVDPEYSRFKKQAEAFEWPLIEGIDASIVPAQGTGMDFFYLYETTTGSMQLHMNNAEYVFGYEYDTAIFPYQWWFASYGGFLGHYTAILEPCTNMPISVNDAVKRKQSAFLEPGASISTVVRIFAGKKNEYFPI